jgi:ubiquinone/menaquinone biosynthesis C-methylase UbiE
VLAARFPDAAFYGVDASLEMLDVARHKLPPAIELKQGWAEKLPYPDEEFNTVVSCNMFHFIRRPDTALAEMFRVLRPKGTLVITDWCDDFLACKLFDRYLRWRGDSHFRTYGLRQCRELLEATGAQNITLEKYRITWLWGLMTAISSKSPKSRSSHEAAPRQSAT